MAYGKYHHWKYIYVFWYRYINIIDFRLVTKATLDEFIMLKIKYIEKWNECWLKETCIY